MSDKAYAEIHPPVGFGCLVGPFDSTHDAYQWVDRLPRDYAWSVGDRATFHYYEIGEVFDPADIDLGVSE